MKQKRHHLTAIVAGLTLLLAGTSRAETICGKARRLKPVRCICGKIIDPVGGPIPGATVKVVKDGTTTASIVTVADGRFDFSELKAGTYELSAHIDGLLPFRSPIETAKPAKKCRRGLLVTLMMIYPANCGSYVLKQ